MTLSKEESQGLIVRLPLLVRLPACSPSPSWGKSQLAAPVGLHLAQPNMVARSPRATRATMPYTLTGEALLALNWLRVLQIDLTC
jgi:hypothetical protein